MWLNPKNAEKVLAELMKLRKPAPIGMTAPIVKDYSDEIRRRLTKKSKVGESYVCAPLLNCSELDQVSEAPIIVWLYFNPLGPTYSQLCAVPVPDTNEMLLTLYSDHPLDTQRAVFGLLPAGNSTEFLKAVKSATAELALTNGHESCPLFGGLPSTVLHRENWCGSAEPPLLSALFAAECLWMYVKESCDASDMAKPCSYLRRFKGDPWERTAMELEESSKHLKEQTLRKSDHALAGKRKSIEREFDTWFDLVTDSDHVRSEFANFRDAWAGAVEHTNTDVYGISKLDALLRLQKLFLWEKITHGFHIDEIAQNPEKYIAMAIRYREAEREIGARREAENENSARRIGV
jgi:hypothetical protein